MHMDNWHANCHSIKSAMFYCEKKRKIKGQTLAEWDWRSRNFVGTGPSAEGVGKVSLG